MKISKQFLLIAAIVCIFFSTGCSKSFLRFDNGESVSKVDSSYDPTKKHVFEAGGGTAEPRTQDSGTTKPLTADSFSETSEKTVEAPVIEGGTSSRGYEKPEAREFGAAKQGMQGGDATGSFSGDTSPEPKSEVFKEAGAAEVDTSSPWYEKPEPRVFGSAKKGMPGGDATGSFSAEPLLRDATPEPDKEFFKEESVGETGTPYEGYEKPEPRVFGSAKQGMPGGDATGSFSAEPFVEDSDNNQISDDVEPFPVPKEEPEVAVLPSEEEVRRQLPYDAAVNLEDIHFAFDKYDLDDTSRAILQRNADYLSSHANSNIEIQGHCDERGSNNYNITLGERRAQSTKAYLVSLGVDESRIHTISYGEERPFCFESNEKCWYQNRRGHFLIAK
jgi:peptidoglycan-associated lipoprotein